LVSDPSLVPYSNLYSVERPFEFTDAFNVASVLATPVAAWVLTEGGFGGVDVGGVVKLAVPLVDDPSTFSAVSLNE
jgi:hypothetical protein